MTDYSPNWFERNKFKKIIAIIDSNKFNYKSEIGELKYIGIKDLVNNIRNNTISEISAKKCLNKLNQIKNAGIIKNKRRTPKQKELSHSFNELLDTILTDKTLKSKSQKDDENENGKTLMSSNEDDENDKILMSSNEDDDENKNENEDDDERMNQNEKHIRIKT